MFIAIALNAQIIITEEVVLGENNSPGGLRKGYQTAMPFYGTAVMYFSTNGQPYRPYWTFNIISPDGRLLLDYKLTEYDCTCLARWWVTWQGGVGARDIPPGSLLSIEGKSCRTIDIDECTTYIYDCSLFHTEEMISPGSLQIKFESDCSQNGFGFMTIKRTAPPCEIGAVAINLSDSLIAPGEKTEILPYFRVQEGSKYSTQVKFNSQQEFTIRNKSGSNYGTLISSSGVRAQNLYNVKMPVWFEANPNLPGDSTRVNLTVSVSKDKILPPDTTDIRIPKSAINNEIEGNTPVFSIKKETASEEWMPDIYGTVAEGCTDDLIVDEPCEECEDTAVEPIIPRAAINVVREAKGVDVCNEDDAIKGFIRLAQNEDDSHNFITPPSACLDKSTGKMKVTIPDLSFNLVVTICPNNLSKYRRISEKEAETNYNGIEDDDLCAVIEDLEKQRSYPLEENTVFMDYIFEELLWLHENIHRDHMIELLNGIMENKKASNPKENYFNNMNKKYKEVINSLNEKFDCDDWNDDIEDNYDEVKEIINEYSKELWQSFFKYVQLYKYDEKITYEDYEKLKVQGSREYQGRLNQIKELLCERIPETETCTICPKKKKNN